MDKKAIFFKTQLVLSLFFILLSYSDCVSNVANAQSTAKPASANSKIRYIPPPLPSAKQILPSGRRKGNASRGGNCIATNNENEVLTSAIPSYPMHVDGEQSNNAEVNNWDLVLGNTSHANPTFLVYVPYTPTELPVKFILQDANRKTLHVSSFAAIKKQPSFIRITVPPTVLLEVGKYYKWYLIVDCGKASPGVEGWVQRIAIDPKLKQQLQQATPQQRVSLYAAHGIWYDALSSLAQLRLEKPQDYSLFLDWISLLDSAGLKAIASKPISNCCAAEQKNALVQSQFPKRTKLLQ